MKSKPTSTNTDPPEGRCIRCVGLLVREWFQDLWLGEQEEGLRCVNCGHREGGSLTSCRKLHEDECDPSPGKSAPRRQFPRGAVCG